MTEVTIKMDEGLLRFSKMFRFLRVIPSPEDLESIIVELCSSGKDGNIPFCLIYVESLPVMCSRKWQGQVKDHCSALTMDKVGSVFTRWCFGKTDN